MDSVIWLKFKDLSYALYIKKVITWSLDLSYESSPIKRSITMYTPETRAVQLATRINIISWLRLLILILSGNTHSLNFVIVLANLHFVGNIWLSLLRISFVCTLTSPQHTPPSHNMLWGTVRIWVCAHVQTHGSLRAGIYWQKNRTCYHSMKIAVSTVHETEGFSKYKPRRRNFCVLWSSLLSMTHHMSLTYKHEQVGSAFKYASVYS